MALVIPQVLPTFMRLCPAISVHLREDSSSAAEQRVLNRDADFGISGPLGRFPTLRYTPLFEDQFAVVFGAQHPLATLERVRWADLAPYQVIRSSQDSRLAMQVRQMLAPTVPEHVRNPICQVSHTATIESLINQGLGVCALPSLSARRVPLNNLECRLLEEPGYHRQVCLIQQDQRSLSPAAQVLLDLILDEIPRSAKSEGLKLLIEG